MEHLLESGKFLGCIVVADDPGRAGGCDAFAIIFAGKLEAFLFTGVMVEPESATGHIGDIGEYIVAAHGYFAILKIFRVSIDHLIHKAEFLQKDGTADPIKVGSG
jgi:hypothetical protein